MMKFLNKSKKGVTLVESVFAVVILAIITVGIITLLTAGSINIFAISKESSVYSETVKKMDLLIASISYSSEDYVVYTENEGIITCTLKPAADIASMLQVDSVTYVVDRYNGETDELNNVRGWYLTISNDYDNPNPEADDDEKILTVTVKGFASNSKGVFDLE